MEFPNARLLIFAKAPIPGHAKTRLIPTLGAQGAADLHAKLLLHTLNTATTNPLCPVELWYASTPDHPLFCQIRDRYKITFKQQQGNDLGDRMGHAVATTLHDASQVIIIGSDCPTLSSDTLREALTQLESGDDAVLAPASDGGYVLIGLKRYDPQLFAGVQWGTEKVLDQTRQRLTELGWQWHETQTYGDIDRPEDLAFFDIKSLKQTQQ